MGKNILIFSDGTGQAGGYMPDETRSNVYKLFRATRVSSDTSIDPGQQVAFYDGGLGSRASGTSSTWVNSSSSSSWNRGTVRRNSWIIRSCPDYS